MSRRSALVIAFVCIVGAGIAIFFIHRSGDRFPYVSGGKVDVKAAVSYWSEEIMRIGPKAAHDEMVEQGDVLFHSQHILAHAFGEALYDTGDLTNIKYCGAGEFLYGCYHEFFGLAALRSGMGVVDQLKDACGDEHGDIECAHGIGHALLAPIGYTESDLVNTLKLCSKLYSASADARGTCADGVFMEYNLQEMLASDQGEASGRNPRPLRSADSFRPCLDLKSFSYECAFELPIWWAFALDITSDFEEKLAQMGALCRDQSPTDAYRRVCFVGIGFAITPFMQFDAAQASRACSEFPADTERTECVTGAARRLADTGRGRPTLCRDLGLTGSDAAYCSLFTIGAKDAHIRIGIPYVIEH